MRATHNRASGQLGTEASPLFIQSITRPESPEDAEHKKYERHEKPTLDRGLTYATWLLSVVTALLAVFTGLMWWATYKLGRDAKEQGRSIIVSERAYVKISHVGHGIELITPDVGQPYRRIVFEIKNWGKTPSSVTDVRIGIERIEYGQLLGNPFPFRESERDSFPNAFLVPSESFRIVKYLPNGDYQSGEKAIWVFAHVDYVDAFGGKWRSGYARIYQDRSDENLVYNSESRDNFDRAREPGDGTDWNDEHKDARTKLHIAT